MGWWGGARLATEADIAAGGERVVRVGMRCVNLASTADGERGSTYHKKKMETQPLNSVNQD